jgi:hypothetical protein
LQSIAGRFQAEFGSRWLISTARSEGSTAAETAARLNLLLADLAASGLRPRFLEIHNYSADGNDLWESLDETERTARRIGADVILGELRYHNDVQAATIAGWLVRHPDSRLVDVIQWPQADPSQVCAIDPTPPYTPGPFARLIAR